MVVSRAANSHRSPAVKDILSSSSRAMSLQQRVSELPSLSFRERFGLTPSTLTPTPTPTSTFQQATSGPLRVTVHLGATPNAPPRRFATRYTRSYTDDLSAATPRDVRGGGRRVRFELPPPPSPMFACGAVARLPSNSGATKHQQQQQQQQQPAALHVAGVDNWLRSRLGTVTTACSSLPPAHTTSRSTTAAATTVAAASRVHDTGRYSRGTLPPTRDYPPPEIALTRGAAAILRAAKEEDEKTLMLILQDGVTEEEVNAVDVSGRSAASHVASHGSLPMLEALIKVRGIDVNKGDKDGNTPLHYAAQAGHADVVSFILTHCADVEVDARNVSGITPLTKAAIQGRNRCVKLLIIGGASATQKDNNRGWRPDEWARHCSRYVCAEMIVQMARHQYVETPSHGARWGSETDIDQLSRSKLSQHKCNTFTSRLKHALWTRGSKRHNTTSNLASHMSSASLHGGPPVLTDRNTFAGTSGLRSAASRRPLDVPQLLVTPVDDATDATSCSSHVAASPAQAPVRDATAARSLSKYSRRLYFKTKK